MRYFWFFLFNILGAYVLILFLIGKGGIIENIKKTEEIARLKEKRLELQIEVEELKNRILLLKSLQNDENHILLEQGKKKDDTIIFKFINKNPQKTLEEDRFENRHKEILYRLYFSVTLAIIMIISGNIVIYIQCTKKGS
ncbi:MAG: FtsB family cell division protein [Brevinematia bacterium]